MYNNKQKYHHTNISKKKRQSKNRKTFYYRKNGVFILFSAPTNREKKEEHLLAHKTQFSSGSNKQRGKCSVWWQRYRKGSEDCFPLSVNVAALPSTHQVQRDKAEGEMGANSDPMCCDFLFYDFMGLLTLLTCGNATITFLLSTSSPISSNSDQLCFVSTFSVYRS